jgi:phosphoribosyl-ATP pyrophosphohydrolase
MSLHREDEVVVWAEQRGIFHMSDPLRQSLKTLEETTELIEATANGNYYELIDAIGDILVTLIVQSRMQGVTLDYCLDKAYNVIKNRKGSMINGKFVKQEENEI